MPSLAEALPAEIARVSAVKERYVGLRGMRGVNVEPGIALIGLSLETAIKASGSGDVVAMLLAYEDLKAISG